MFMLFYTANGPNLQCLLPKWHFPRYDYKRKNKTSFKKGDRQDMQNYRLLSILSAFHKILEKLINNRLLSFLKKA